MVEIVDRTGEPYCIWGTVENMYFRLEPTEDCITEIRDVSFDLYERCLEFIKDVGNVVDSYISNNINKAEKEIEQKLNKCNPDSLASHLARKITIETEGREKIKLSPETIRDIADDPFVAEAISKFFKKKTKKFLRNSIAESTQNDINDILTVNSVHRR
jgi:hypothetical protein